MRRWLLAGALVLSALAVSPQGAAEAAHPCAAYRTTALRFFTRAQWRWPVRQIMYLESRCNPGATSPAGARGLMQIMPFWADDCGGWPDRLYRPRFNLRCAKYVYRQQGWWAWDVYPP